jgi:hypothetical protein
MKISAGIIGGSVAVVPLDKKSHSSVTSEIWEILSKYLNKLLYKSNVSCIREYT